MFKYLYIYCLFLIPFVTIAQNESNIWYFGDKAGIDFNSGSAVILNDGPMNTLEGCASICDGQGNLLFYTNGEYVLNKNHVVMGNSQGLLGGNYSSTQSSIIVKKPDTSSIYYIFTVDHLTGSKGVKYSEIDMSLLGGLGGFNSNINIDIVDSVCEKIIAVKHANETDFWIIVKLNSLNVFHSYLLTDSGLSILPVISNSGLNNAGIGYLKASLDGSNIVSANYYSDNVDLFDFDNSTGVLSNSRTLTGLNFRNPYGVEFSPNGDLLYVSTGVGVTNISQFNLLGGTSSAINSSRVIVGTGNGMPGSLQIGPDYRIYSARHGEEYLGIINNPDLLGTSCGYLNNALFLGDGESMLGLPNFTNSILAPTIISSINFEFIAKNFCYRDSAIFTITPTNLIDSVLWDFGDVNSGINNMSKNINSTHFFTDTGSFDVTLVIYYGTDTSIITKSFYVIPLPVVNLINDTIICEFDTIILDLGLENARYLWSDDSDESTINVFRSGIYWCEVIVDGCNVFDTVNIDECPNKVSLTLPNVFTPNQDGINDFFIPIERRGIKVMETKIYNRWGKLIFSSNNLDIEWDGGIISDGTYYWVVEYSDIYYNQTSLKGYVNLMR